MGSLKCFFCKEMGLTGDDVLFCAHQGANAFLLAMRVVSFKFVREFKCHNRKPGIIVRASFVFFAVDLFRCASEGEIPPFTVDIAHADVPLAGFEGFAEEASA